MLSRYVRDARAFEENAAGVALRDAFREAVKNLRAYAEDRPLEAVVTPEVYDFST